MKHAKTMRHFLSTILLLFFSIYSTCPDGTNVSSECVEAHQPRRALITGIAGQDGSYLTEFLLDKGYHVHGITLPGFDLDLVLQKEKAQRVFVHYGDITDFTVVHDLIKDIKPHEIYHLAAQSNIVKSYIIPKETLEINILGTLNILEAIRLTNQANSAKFFHASSAYLFWKKAENPQSEATPFHPESPYAISKSYAHGITTMYREKYNIFACNGILFNHESPHRGPDFVTRKITLAVAAYAHGEKTVLKLGNLDTARDWGYAPDYIEAMWLMLQQERSDDYVIATGTTHTVREFVECAYKQVGIDIGWHGNDLDEVGVDQHTGDIIVTIDPTLFRSKEPYVLRGNIEKAQKILGWQPKTTFATLVKIMVDHDVEFYHKTTVNAPEREPRANSTINNSEVLPACAP